MAFDVKSIALSVLLLGAASAPGFAQSVQSTTTLSLGGDAEQRSVQYDCAAFGQIGVIYIDAAPNFLALVPHEGDNLVFVAVLSGSGVRYASGNFEWWTKGAEASLHDLTAAEGAAPLATCSEITNTP